MQGRCGLIIGNLGASAATTWEESTPNPAPWMISVVYLLGEQRLGVYVMFLIDHNHAML